MRLDFKRWTKIFKGFGVIDTVLLIIQLVRKNMLWFFGLLAFGLLLLGVWLWLDSILERYRKILDRLAREFDELRTRCCTQCRQGLEDGERRRSIVRKVDGWFFSGNFLTNFTERLDDFIEFEYAFDFDFKQAAARNLFWDIRARKGESEKAFRICREDAGRDDPNDFNMIIGFIWELQTLLRNSGDEKSLFLINPWDVFFSKEKRELLNRMLDTLEDLRNRIGASCEGSPPPVNIDWFERRHAVTGGEAFRQYRRNEARRLGLKIADLMFEGQRVLFLNYPKDWGLFTKLTAAGEDGPEKGSIEDKRPELDRGETRFVLQEELAEFKPTSTRFQLIVSFHCMQHLSRELSELYYKKLIGKLTNGGKFVLLAAISRSPDTDAFAVEGMSGYRAFFLPPQAALPLKGERADTSVSECLFRDVKIDTKAERKGSGVLIKDSVDGKIVGSILEFGKRRLLNLKRKMPEIDHREPDRKYEAVPGKENDFQRLAFRFARNEDDKPDPRRGTLYLFDRSGKKYCFGVFALDAKESNDIEDVGERLKLAAGQLPAKNPFLWCRVDYEKMMKLGMPDYDPKNLRPCDYKFRTFDFETDGGKASATLCLEKNSALDRDNYIILDLGGCGVYAGYYPVKQLIPEELFDGELNNEDKNSVTHEISWKSLKDLLSERGLVPEEVFFHMLGPRAANTEWGREVLQDQNEKNVFDELEQKLNCLFRQKPGEGLERLEELDVHNVMIVASKKGKSA